MTKLASCVVLYHPEDDTFDNITSYADQVEILIAVDNSIDKNSLLVDRLKEKYQEKLIYIDNGDNLGIATALNIACDKAIELGFEWILTMDQDTRFENFDHYLACLESVKDKDDVALIAANTKREKTKVENPTLNYTEEFIVITSANILNLKQFEKIGRFEDKLFIDSVDHDYCIRVYINELKILLFLDVYVEHKLGERFLRKNLITRKESYKREHNAQRTYYIARNYLYIASRYGNLSPKELKFSYIINNVFIHGITKILLYEPDKLKKIKAKFIGLYHFLIGRYGRYDLK